MRPGEPLYQHGQGGNDGESRRFIAVIALSLAVVWVYSTFFAPKPPLPDETIPPAVETVADPASDGDAVALEPLADDDSAGGGGSSDDDSAADGAVHGGQPRQSATRPEPALETWSIDRGLYAATFTNQGGGPSHWILRDYADELELSWLPSWFWNGFKSGFKFERFTLRCPEGVPVDVVRNQAHATQLVPTFGATVPGIDGPRWEVLERGDEHMTFRTWDGDLEITVGYDVPREGYLVDYQLTVRNTGDQARSISPKMSVFQPIAPAKNRYTSSTTPFVELDGKVKEYTVKSLDKKGLIQVTDKAVRFAGIGERYFMTALVPAEPPVGFEAGPMGWMGEDMLSLVNQPSFDQATGDQANRVYRSTLLFAERSLAPGESETLTFDLYMGPKVLSDLKELGVGLETTVQYGLFTIIARPMLWLLRFMYGLVGSWGIAIILLTVVVKLLVWPLDQKSYQSMKKMRVLAPRMQEIRDQYKSDPQRQQQEIMNMYKEEGANPFSGCFPMLIQMPIWFALYRVLWNSIELYQVPFLYFCDLTARDPLCIFPIALSAVMIVQQRMSPPPTDPNQKMMMQLMPIFFAFIMFALPSGLVLYILVSSLLRLLQQWLVNRSNDDEPEAQAPANKSKKKK